MLKLHEYAERLLNDLDKLDWPEKVRKCNATGLAKAMVVKLILIVEDTDKAITVYTTRPDTHCVVLILF